MENNNGYNNGYNNNYPNDNNVYQNNNANNVYDGNYQNDNANNVYDNNYQNDNANNVYNAGYDNIPPVINFFNPYEPIVPATNPGTGFGTVALVMGVLSILTPWIGFIMGIIGIVFGAKSKKKSRIDGMNPVGTAKIGTVLSWIGLVLWILLLAALIVVIVLRVNGSLDENGWLNELLERWKFELNHPNIDKNNGGRIREIEL